METFKVDLQAGWCDCAKYQAFFFEEAKLAHLNGNGENRT